MLTIYNIKMVSKLLGISPITIRAWETRYQVIQPQRSEGGHRLYSDKDVEDLRWLLIQTKEKGLSISHASQLLLKQKQTNVTAATVTDEEPRSTYTSVQNDLYHALLNMDIEKSEHIVDLGFSMYPLDEMIHKVLVPLMIRVGDEWEQGIISVAQEHMVSEFVKQRYIQFFRLFQRNPSLPKVIALCPAGERHEVGLLLFSLFLRRKGLDVIYLGADTPVDGIGEMLIRSDANWLCLTLTDPKRLDNTIKYIEHILTIRPQVKIILGGKGFTALDSHHPYYDFLIGDHNDEWERWYQQQLVHI
ncbi:MAG: MerR family transcriptional regulator [Candidatus Pristimantibacillus lignocellulolyticus]|uniref:MerR family transcriptional regulator n=1 Tax=Candidatus Pristimantibacillus lignocellulolyticus TaxID=2994561 RepID=A0A9J6ZHA4_9BACL|nr:MAG: MerR family transcriptional regulator [Candidatus Pristimantibacillus lignocellulolyticus]